MVYQEPFQCSDLGEVPTATKGNVSRGRKEKETKRTSSKDSRRIQLICRHHYRPAACFSSTVVDVSLAHSVDMVGIVRYGEAGEDEEASVSRVEGRGRKRG